MDINFKSDYSVRIPRSSYHCQIGALMPVNVDGKDQNLGVVFTGFITRKATTVVLRMNLVDDKGQETTCCIAVKIGFADFNMFRDGCNLLFAKAFRIGDKTVNESPQELLKKLADKISTSPSYLTLAGDFLGGNSCKGGGEPVTLLL